jgi:hypothetical protein
MIGAMRLGVGCRQKKQRNLNINDHKRLRGSNFILSYELLPEFIGMMVPSRFY